MQTWPFMQATVQQDSAPIPPPLRAHAHAHACATHARTARKYRAGGGPCYLPSRSAICTLTYRTQLISLRASCLLSEHRPGTGRCVFVDRGFPMKITVPTCASRVPFEKKKKKEERNIPIVRDRRRDIVSRVRREHTSGSFRYRVAIIGISKKKGN